MVSSTNPRSRYARALDHYEGTLEARGNIWNNTLALGKSLIEGAKHVVENGAKAMGLRPGMAGGMTGGGMMGGGMMGGVGGGYMDPTLAATGGVGAYDPTLAGTGTLGG